ncbi:MAG: transposase [Ignavibacteria bacterium]|nr:transposase [Ignavibacteria bacterium]
MEVKRKRKFSKEFKEDVLNMLKTGQKNVPELSKELGIAQQVIYRWNKKYNGTGSVEVEKISHQEKELRELRSRLADVTEERDILKKAVNIFSKQGNSK